MIKLFSKGVYLINNKEIIEDCNDINLILKNKLGNKCINKEEARKNTIAIIFKMSIMYQKIKTSYK